MVDPRTERVKHISESVARDEYRVDPEAVAEAILRRLLADREGIAAEATAEA